MRRSKWLLIAPALLLLAVYTLGWAVYRIDCGEGPGRWHVDFSLQHTQNAMCEEVSAVELTVRALA